MYEIIWTNIISLLLGFTIGFFVGRKNHTKFNTKNIIGLAILLGWLSSLIAEIALTGIYSTPWMVHGIMGGVAGYYFGFKIDIPWSKK